MEEFVKLEQLVQNTGVSYEDARNALRACDGKMLDAMEYLETLGKFRTHKSDNIDPRFAPITEEEMEAAAMRRDERLYAVPETKAEIKAARKAEKKAAKAEKKAEKRAVKEDRQYEKEVYRENKKGGFGAFLRKIFRFLIVNKLTISKDGRSIANLPLLAVLIISSISLGSVIVAVIISIFFGFDYSLNGGSKYRNEYRQIADYRDAAVYTNRDFDHVA